MIVYLDTGPLKGLLDPNDQEHSHAIEAFERLEQARATVCCPYPALLELHRLLMYRKPSRTDASRKALTALAFVAERFPTVYPVEADRQVAIATLGRYLDQKLTLTDATIAAMASREGAAVLTFDRHHFGLMGVEVFS